MSEPLYLIQPDLGGEVGVQKRDGEGVTILDKYVVLPGHFSDAKSWVPTDLSDKPEIVRSACLLHWSQPAILARYMAEHPYVAPAAPPDPLTLPATRRQINAALITVGISTTPDAWMSELLTHIEDEKARALAVNDWAEAPSFVRSAPLFNNAGLLAAAGMTSAQVDALWALAVTLPA